jgi:tetratricopeptide (TPR) repeat protein
LSVDPPHTRTDKNGKFVIPSKQFNKPSFPASFGTNIESFSVNASTIDDKSGGYNLKDYEEKKEINVIIYVKPWEQGLNDEREYFSYVQSLYNYCVSGRFGVEVPSVEGGCDTWELDYAITKHERYLKKWNNPTKGQISHFANILYSLGYLYKKKGDYKKALDTFKNAKMFEKNLGVDLRQKEYESQINDLQQLIHKRQ